MMRIMVKFSQSENENYGKIWPIRKFRTRTKLDTYVTVRAIRAAVHPEIVPLRFLIFSIIIIGM